VIYLDKQLRGELRESMVNPNVLSGSHNSLPVTEELIAAAIAGVVNSARAQGQSLDELTRLVLAEDQDLDWVTRQWLSEIVTEAWQDSSAIASEIAIEAV
jgi:hypothetical protein